MEEQENPVVGEDVYVDTCLFLSHPEDNFHGGRCRISRVEKPSWAREDLYIAIEEDPGTLYNWNLLKERQEELQREFGDQRGYLMHAPPAGTISPQSPEPASDGEGSHVGVETSADRRPWWRFWP